MFKDLAATFVAIRNKSRIAALNKKIEQATIDRADAKQRALDAQTQRDALVSTLTKVTQ